MEANPPILSGTSEKESLGSISGSVEQASSISNSFVRSSNLAFGFYLFFLVSVFSSPLLSAENEFIGGIIGYVSIGLFLAFAICHLRTFKLQNQFYSLMDKEKNQGEIFLYFLLGMPLYFFMYFYFVSRMRIMKSRVE